MEVDPLPDRHTIFLDFTERALAKWGKLDWFNSEKVYCISRGCIMGDLGEHNRVTFNTDTMPKSARSLSALICSHFLTFECIGCM
jgi:hypothetical protein